MNTNVVIAIIAGVVVVAAGIVVFATKPTVNSEKVERYDSDTDTAASHNQPIPTGSMDTELKIEDVKIGTGKEAKAGDMVEVHYVGTFTDGRKFDSSRDRGTPFSFPLGAGRVIKGWDQGVAGMKEGGIRKLTIPPALGYGSEDYSSIPGGSTLLFEVELLRVQ